MEFMKTKAELYTVERTTQHQKELSEETTPTTLSFAAYTGRESLKA